MEKLSIIVPINNILPQEINALMDSIFHQTFGFSNIEIIFVDNGLVISKSKDLISNLIENNVNVHYVPLDGNFDDIYAYFVGFANAKTDYVILFNFENILKPNSCKLLYDEINYSNADMVIGKYESKSFEDVFFNKSSFDKLVFDSNGFNQDLLSIKFVSSSRIYNKTFILNIFSRIKVKSLSQFNFLTLLNSKKIVVIAK